MKNVKNKFETKNYTIIISFIIVCLCLIIGIPTLAKLKNRSSLYTTTAWDGTIATSYKQGDGTKENPFIISNGSEFAFFIENLKTQDYKDNYFELSNDIIINSGIFEYSESEGIKYITNEIEYLVKDNTNEYYDKDGLIAGTINAITPTKNFKGNFNGKSFTIFGLYIIDNTQENIALFQNLEGTISDVYISNFASYGIGNVSGVAINANNAVISNVLVDGEIVNKSSFKENVTDISPFSITSKLEETVTNLSLNSLEIEGTINSIKLTGSYESNANSIIKINGTEILNNNFEIDLGHNLVNEIPISVTSDIDGAVINFSNLKYVVEYYNDITSGIVSNSTNLTLNNVINKSNVYGMYIAAGFVGKANENLTITHSYNNGNIKSLNISGGITGLIKNNVRNVLIENVYNSGVVNSSMSGGILGLVKDNVGQINIDNTINVSENYPINTVINTTVNVLNGYSTNGLSIYSGSLINSFTQTQIENLYKKEFMVNLSYNEFISFSDVEINNSNIWIYETNSMPILYIDDLNDPVANINLNKYSWNNLSFDLNVISVENSITFSIDEVSSTNPIKEKYYHVEKSRVPLTLDQLNQLATWKTYEDVVKIEDSGYYVIYAKIVDSNNKTIYLNTDVIALNKSGFKTELIMEQYVWDKSKTDLGEIYLNKDINISVAAQDDLYNIQSIEYYVSKEKILEENITEWIPYTNPISITTPGKYIVYAKIENGENVVKYINTDFLIYNGYNQSIKIGNKNLDYQTNYVTNNSSINLTFERNFDLKFKNGYTHNLISNILLPNGTKITLLDKINNKVYQLNINTDEDLYGYNDSCIGNLNCSKYATYKFSLFKEIGVLNDSYYDETLSYNKTITKEKYIVIIDFKDTVLTDNYYDVLFYMAIKNQSNEILYKTLESDISNINIYSNIDNKKIVTSHSIINDYDNQIIYYNSNSETSINFTSLLEFSTINNKQIIDTNYENKKFGIVIKLYNSENESINKKYLNNIIFELNGKEYFANNENFVIINLGNIVNTDIKNLKIKTKENSSGLKNGSYYIKINGFISDDGYYHDNLYSEELIIPLVVENQILDSVNYGFDIQMNPESMIINKKLESHLAIFNINYLGQLTNPNIKISLYEKISTTAYNQDYKLVDLGTYSSNELISSGEKQYLIDVLNSSYSLNIIPSNFNNNGYKYVFELYDGTKKISKIEKYFIVK